MPVKYVTYGTRRVKVSRRWFVVLTEADRDKVGFTINSGHRTFDQQAALFRQNMFGPGRPRPGRPLTAVPSHTAPHIRSRRADHALDVNSLDGGENRLQRWLERHGVDTSNPVPGESWHLEVNPRDLERLARRIQRRQARRKKAKAKPKPKAKPRPKAPTKLNAVGREHLIRFEGEVLHAYNDPAGHATFGVGHLLHRGRCTGADFARFGSKDKPKPAGEMRKLSRRFLAQDAERFERAVLKHVPVRFRRTHEQFNALVSLSFNLGEEILTPGPPLESVGRALRGRSARAVGDAMLLFDKAGGKTLPGLTRRRRAERALFLRGS